MSDKDTGDPNDSMTERTKSWLPWVVGLTLNLAVLLVGFSTSYARQGSQGEATIKAVSDLKSSIDEQNNKLARINDSINDLKTSAALAASNLSAQDGKIQDLSSRVQTLEQRLQSQGERLARKGI